MDDPTRAAEQPGMVTSPEALDKHRRLVKKLGAEPIHLNDWLERNKQGQTLPRLAVAFTFDDDWRDNYQHAHPLLKAQNAPATNFLVTRMFDTDKTFWPEQVLTGAFTTGNHTKLVFSHITSGDLRAGAEVQTYSLCRALQVSDQIAPTAVFLNESIRFDKLTALGILGGLADQKRSGPSTTAHNVGRIPGFLPESVSSTG